MPLPFQTPGYQDLELSTQLVIAEALKRGVKVEVLDRSTQFIRLSKGKHFEYIQAGTKTAKDSYVVSEILGNKLVTKKILEEQGLRVPKGNHYQNLLDALKAYSIFKKQKIVVKPKTTNYGIGISILKKNSSEEAFRKAIKTAFHYDKSILIEEFIAGIECRFLVINNKTVAVLNRVPANIVGDGKNSIQQLVTQKNKDPRRGQGYKTPLELIQIGPTEKTVLNEQGFSLKSIPAKGQTVFLRHNSNISTGGDSIDFTAQIHPGYKKIAQQAAAAVGAKICGVDMISANFQQAPTKKSYALIELNYNPVLYFHDFPYQGKNHHTAKYVLDLLGF